MRSFVHFETIILLLCCVHVQCSMCTRCWHPCESLILEHANGEFKNGYHHHSHHIANGTKYNNKKKSRGEYGAELCRKKGIIALRSVVCRWMVIIEKYGVAHKTQSRAQLIKCWMCLNNNYKVNDSRLTRFGLTQYCVKKRLHTDKHKVCLICYNLFFSHFLPSFIVYCMMCLCTK